MHFLCSEEIYLLCDLNRRTVLKGSAEWEPGFVPHQTEATGPLASRCRNQRRNALLGRHEVRAERRRAQRLLRDRCTCSVYNDRDLNPLPDPLMTTANSVFRAPHAIVLCKSCASWTSWSRTLFLATLQFLTLPGPLGFPLQLIAFPKHRNAAGNSGAR